MNDEIRENISCPQFGDNHYGKWGALNLEQRKKIKDLLNKIDNLKIIEKKYIQLQSNWNSLREWLKATLTNEEFCYLAENAKDRCRYDVFNEVLDKMNELEGKDKE